MFRLLLCLSLVVIVGCHGNSANTTEKQAIDCNDRGLEAFKKGDTDKAIADFNEALKLDPKLAMAYYNRGFVWSGKGEYDKAIADFDQALAINKSDARIFDSRGEAWRNKGDFDKAIADFNEALRLTPDDAKAYSNRGTLEDLKGEYDKALADFNETVRLEPKNAVGYCNLALLYAACPEAKYRDGAKAVENASKAYELDGGKHWTILDAQAAAYAQSGDFEKAKDCESKAIDLAPNEKIKQRCQACLSLYKQGKPYRSEPMKKK